MRRMFSEKQIENFIKSTKKDIATLVDKDGHERFIEGDIELETISGVSKKYGKWSLSGSHLLIVIAIDVANGTALSGNKLTTINLPSWIIEKISPIVSTRVLSGSLSLLDSSYGAQNVSYSMVKQSGKIEVYLGTLTLTADRTGRMNIDLLIDNE